MSTNKLDVAIRAFTGALLVSMLLTACSKPAPAPATETTPPAETVPPDSAPTAPAQPAPDAPPPTEPSAAPKPSAALEPSLQSMKVAAHSAKLSVPAELRYQFDGAALPNQPVTLHLAAVPRVAHGNLSMSIKQVVGVDLVGGGMTQQKTDGSEVYRKQFSVTRGNSAPAELRVLVTMQTAEGQSFGFFSVPFDGGTNAQKQESVKQR